MLAWPAMRRPGVAVSVATAMLLGAVFAGDSVWTAIAVLALAGGWSALALAGRTTVPRGGTVLLGIVFAIAAWSGLSIAWSVAPDLSWTELNRTLVFAGFVAVGALLGAAGPTACRWAATALLTALGAAVLWALAGKAIPALFPDGGRVARLRDPFGYWNALALAADILLVLALTSRPMPARRVYCALEAWCSDMPRSSRCCSRPPAPAWRAQSSGWRSGSGSVRTGSSRRSSRSRPSCPAAWSRPGHSPGPHSWRTRSHVPIAWRTAPGSACCSSSEARSRRSRRLRFGRSTGAAGRARPRVEGAGRCRRHRRGHRPPPQRRPDCGRVRWGGGGERPNRFKSLSSNNRSAWWGEAWDIFRAEPLQGAGANTFAVARKRYRETASAVSQPHSVPLQVLAGTGLGGLGLFLALAAAAAFAAVGALRRLDGVERNAAAALAVALALWFIHALVDYDWDFVEVTGPVLLVAGVLAAAGRPARPAGGAARGARGCAVALAAAASIATPWLAERELRKVNTALDRGEIEAATDAVERARSLDPLSLGPAFAEARVAEVRRREVAAHEAYLEATRLQPENPESWLQLGLYEFHTGDRCGAYRHLNQAYTLDPAGKEWTPGGPLEISLAWVNAGNCS